MALEAVGASPLSRPKIKPLRKGGVFHGGVGGWRLEPPPKAVGETGQWRAARQSSLESYAFKDEVVGSPKVTKPHHSLL